MKGWMILMYNINWSIRTHNKNFWIIMIPIVPLLFEYLTNQSTP